MNKKRLLALIFLCIFHCYNGYAINMDKIKSIESNGNPLAYNEKSGAIGLYQITKVCLKEYNNFNEIKYTRQDLFNGKINEKIAKWYLEVRIPQMLRYYKKEVSDKNIIIAYNAGISFVLNGKLPNETKNYIFKYMR